MQAWPGRHIVQESADYTSSPQAALDTVRSFLILGRVLGEKWGGWGES